MESRARFLGHPIHQMLIVFPLGLLGMAVVFDIIHLIYGARDLALSSFYMIGAGVITGLLAAVFGFIDWAAIPSHTRAKSVGRWHAIGNVVLIVLFAISWWLRRDNPSEPTTLAFLLSLIGLGLAVVTGWLGGELIGRLGVGVYADANLDAPSSLSPTPARSASSERRL